MARLKKRRQPSFSEDRELQAVLNKLTVGFNGKLLDDRLSNYYYYYYIWGKKRPSKYKSSNIVTKYPKASLLSCLIDPDKIKSETTIDYQKELIHNESNASPFLHKIVKRLASSVGVTEIAQVIQDHFSLVVLASKDNLDKFVDNLGNNRISRNKEYNIQHLLYIYQKNKYVPWHNVSQTVYNVLFDKCLSEKKQAEIDKLLFQAADKITPNRQRPLVFKNGYYDWKADKIKAFDYQIYNDEVLPYDFTRNTKDCLSSVVTTSDNDVYQNLLDLVSFAINPYLHTGNEIWCYGSERQQNNFMYFLNAFTVKIGCLYNNVFLKNGVNARVNLIKRYKTFQDTHIMYFDRANRRSNIDYDKLVNFLNSGGYGDLLTFDGKTTGKQHLPIILSKELPNKHKFDKEYIDYLPKLDLSKLKFNFDVTNGSEKWQEIAINGYINAVKGKDIEQIIKERNGTNNGSQ